MRRTIKLIKASADLVHAYVHGSLSMTDLVDAISDETNDVEVGAYLALHIVSHLPDSDEVEFRKILAQRIK